ncbi:hypothetical protein CP556_15325 [Natrinema sp. CBA1119]|nr:hypothetical protein CP556_15325 [Natrinema sp. CBA1119]
MDVIADRGRYRIPWVGHSVLGAFDAFDADEILSYCFETAVSTRVGATPRVGSDHPSWSYPFETAGMNQPATEQTAAVRRMGCAHIGSE